MPAIANQRSLRPTSTSLDRVAAISPELFLSRYYAANEPMLWESFLRNSPAVRNWSPQHFAERFGDVTVEVMTELKQHPNYELKGNRQGQTMSIRDLVQTIERDPDGGDLYLVAQCHALQQPELAPLLEDLKLDPAFFDSHNSSEKINVWMGPANTVTPLHYDLSNLLLAQVYGRKRVKLISPLNTGHLYNHRGGYSQVDPEQPDFNKFPLFENVTVYTVLLEAGDALFLPFGWWHHVRSLSSSISLSIGSFVWPNPFVATE